MNALGWTVSGLGLAAAAGIGLVAVGDWRWRAATQAQMALLEAARVPAPAGLNKVSDARELDGLPAPVQRYFRAVLQDGQAFIAAATFEFAGRVNLSATGGEQWKPFTSTQRAVTHRPGFLWNGRVLMLPGLAVRVHDSYIAGVGALDAAMLGLFTVAGVQGGGEISRGELMRYFAEMPWYPTALLPSQGVHWQAVDDRSSKATLVDGQISLSLLFRFDDAASILRAGVGAVRAFLVARLGVRPATDAGPVGERADGLLPGGRRAAAGLARERYGGCQAPGAAAGHAAAAGMDRRVGNRAGRSGCMAHRAAGVPISPAHRALCHRHAQLPLGGYLTRGHLQCRPERAP